MENTDLYYIYNYRGKQVVNSVPPAAMLLIDLGVMALTVIFSSKENYRRPPQHEFVGVISKAKEPIKEPQKLILHANND